MAKPEIRVRGLREVAAGFKEIDRDYGKALQRGLKGVGNQVLGAIRARVPGGAGSALKVRATQRGFGIAFPAGEGLETYDFYPWLDFGGSTGKGHQQGQPWSGSIRRERLDGGRYIYPTLADNREEIGNAAADVLLDVARSAGFVTRGG